MYILSFLSIMNICIFNNKHTSKQPQTDWCWTWWSWNYISDQLTMLLGLLTFWGNTSYRTYFGISLSELRTYYGYHRSTFIRSKAPDGYEIQFIPVLFPGMNNVLHYHYHWHCFYSLGVFNESMNSLALPVKREMFFHSLQSGRSCTLLENHCHQDQQMQHYYISVNLVLVNHQNLKC